VGLTGKPAAGTNFDDEMFVIMNIKGTYTGTIKGQGSDARGRTMDVSADVWFEIDTVTKHSLGGHNYNVSGSFGTGRYNGKSVTGTFHGNYTMTEEATVFLQPQKGSLDLYMNGGKYDGPDFAFWGMDVQSSGTATNVGASVIVSIKDTFSGMLNTTVTLTRR
jgi:hypothetical protein